MSQLSLVEDVTRAMSILAPKLKTSSPLTRLHANLRASATPSRNKRERLVMADVLRDLGRDMMNEALTINSWSDRRRAVAFRDGLAISLQMALGLAAGRYQEPPPPRSPLSQGAVGGPFNLPRALPSHPVGG
jgi:hypothetical protein